LVRDVVPDEIDNVDEMMTQFKGKEEELLETLRTMKERDVAKKARLESHKIARRNTRAAARGRNEDFPPVIPEVSSPHRPGHAFEVTHDPPNVRSVQTDSTSADYTTDDGTDNTSLTPEAKGSFEQATKVDQDAAAVAAAEWAIQRSLSRLMDREQFTKSSLS
jgi:hypothetical protein